jgi:serine/threonine protein kinase
MKVHELLKHENIIKFIASGEDGKITKENSDSIESLFYIITEYVPQGTLYDLVRHTSGLGENGARFLMK